MFSSNTHWPQLTTPFYSILFETSICQFNSSTRSPIIPDEVREHLTRDQRPFLHPESLQILQIHRSMTVLLLFSSLMFYRVQVREHLTRDQRPFLHPESLQILQIHRSMTVLLLFSSLMFYRVGQRTPDKRSDHSFIQNHSRVLQIHISMTVLSSLQFTHVSTGFQVREHLTRDQRDHSFIQKHSRSSDSQIHDGALLFSSLIFYRVQGQRTPDKRSETIPSSRITPDLQDSQIHDGASFSSVHSCSTGFRSENT